MMTSQYLQSDEQMPNTLIQNTLKSFADIDIYPLIEASHIPRSPMPLIDIDRPPYQILLHHNMKTHID